MFGNGFPDDWSALKRLIWLKLMLGSGSSSIIKTVKGALIHITNALDEPVKKLVAEFAPVQDLHGYDNPWPAGGGKNLLNVTAESKTSFGITFTVNDDGTVNVNGKATSQPILALASITLPAGSYVLSGTPDGGGSGLYFIYFPSSGMQGGDYGSGFSFTLTEETTLTPTILVRNGVTVNNKLFKPMICLASAQNPTTFAPYSNVCPISGWMGCNVTRTGVNLYDGVWEPGTISERTGANSGSSTDYFRSKNYLPVPKGKCYWYHALRTEVFRQFYYDKDYTYLGFTTDRWNSVIPSTTPEFFDKIAYVRFRVAAAWEESDQTISINYPSTDTTYHAYHGQTIPINWQSSAGTIYGGTATLNEDGSADVVNDYVSLSLDGDAINATWAELDVDRTSAGFYRSAQDWANAGYPTPVASGGIFDYCKTGNVYKNDNWWTANFLFSSGNFNRFEMRIPKAVLADYSTYPMALSSAKAYLDAHPLQAVYRIAPQTYHFDNIGQLYTYLGTNNVWTDLNGDVTLTYLADGKVNSLTALNMLLGGTYTPSTDVSDREALDIIMGETT